MHQLRHFNILQLQLKHPLHFKQPYLSKPPPIH